MNGVGSGIASFGPFRLSPATREIERDDTVRTIAADLRADRFVRVSIESHALRGKS